MAVTVSGTQITFSDGTTQSTAAVRAVRSLYVTTSRTYTKPSDVISLAFFVSGATGGRYTQFANSTGGVGGAGYAEKYIASPASSYVITIGAAGSNGGAGGTTTVDTISITGSGGVTGNAGSSGGVATGGTFNANGGAGGNANNAQGTGGGGGGAGGSRAGNGFAGGSGGGGYASGTGGGGGGTGGVGSTAGANSPGAGGAAATMVNNAAISLTPMWTPAGGIGTFNSGQAGAVVTPYLEYDSNTGTNQWVYASGLGGAGASGSTLAVYGVQLQGGHGGTGGHGYLNNSTTNIPGQSAIVQILEFLT